VQRDSHYRHISHRSAGTSAARATAELACA
jgi:hypothetical protein